MKFLKRKSHYSQAVKILFIFDNLSKILNFAKNIIITAALGFTKVPDAFNLSRSINGTFYNTLSNALLAGTLPYLNEREDTQEKINFLYSLIILVLSLFILLSIIIVLNFAPIIDVLAPGFEEGQKKLVFMFFILQLPLSIITVFTKAFESYFRSEKIFGIANVIKLLVSVIAFLLIFFFIKKSYYVLALGPLIGTLIGFFYFLYQIPKKMTMFDKKVFGVIKFALPLVLGGSFTIINSFVDKGFSSTLPEGHLTTLDLGARLFEQVKGLITGPIIGALYAFLSLAISKKEYKDVQNKITKLSDSMITIFTLIFLGYVLLGRWGLSFIFQHGLVESNNIELLFKVTLILLPLSFSLQSIIGLVLYSFKNTKVPTISGVGTTLLNIVLNYIFVRKYGIYALATSTLLVVLLNSVICSYYVKYKYKLVSYTQRHFILVLTCVISAFLLIIFKEHTNYLKVIILFIICSELILLKFLTVSIVKKAIKKIINK